MRIVKFNDIKDFFRRMAILRADSTYGIAKHYMKIDGEFVPVLYSHKEDADAALAEISKLNPDVVLYTEEEYGKEMGFARYSDSRMYGFEGKDGIVDFVDDEKTVSFYFN